MSNELAVIGFDRYQITVTPSALKQKDEALELGKTFTLCHSDADQRDVIAASALCRQLLKGMKATKEKVKRPILDAENAVQAAYNEYCKPLEAEAMRLEQLAAGWQRQVLKEAAERRRAIEDSQRMDRDAAMVDRESEQAYLKRKEEEHHVRRLEDLAAIGEAETDDDRDNAQLIADQHAEDDAEEFRMIQESIREAEERRTEEARSRAMALQVAAPKATGARVRESYDFTVDDVLLLLEFRPDLVDVIPKRGLILNAISEGAKIPGLHVFPTVKLTAKA